MTENSTGWSFASAREPARFAAAENRDSPQTEHAFRSPGTLCGIAEEQVIVYRHLFEATNIRACPSCREQGATVPAAPCAQERLHNRVLSAAPGHLRARLLDTLRNGAEISIWVNGPASAIAWHARPPTASPTEPRPPGNCSPPTTGSALPGSPSPPASSSSYCRSTQTRS